MTTLVAADHRRRCRLDHIVEPGLGGDSRSPHPTGAPCRGRCRCGPSATPARGRRFPDVGQVIDRGADAVAGAGGVLEHEHRQLVSLFGIRSRRASARTARRPERPAARCPASRPSAAVRADVHDHVAGADTSAPTLQLVGHRRHRLVPEVLVAAAQVDEIRRVDRDRIDAQPPPGALGTRPAPPVAPNACATRSDCR